MLIYAVDLGTTNLKVVLYDESLRALAVAREVMRYRREGDRVEFDPEHVFDTVLELIRRCAADADVADAEGAHIVVTGQAESLVLVGGDGRSIAPAVSWMDERSHREAAEIRAEFGADEAFSITGEPEPVPTWPATKLRWWARHEPQLLAAAHRVLMIKDYVLLRLTGIAVGEETTRGFTYLYDVRERRYWPEMLAFCGVRPDTLPPIVPAGAVVGPVLADVREMLPPAESYTVNAGALDHFCAMVGTGAYRPGVVNASAGTVLALSLVAGDAPFDPRMPVSFHAGLRPGETVLFTCADSGGVALEWFREQIAGDLSFDALDAGLRGREHRDAPLFLPYLTGVNPPDFNPAARGAFIDLQLRHDRIDLAFAVMEGIAHLLRRNLDDLALHGQVVTEIVSAGGGTASAFWNQLKADVCRADLRVPEEQEAACRGAAILVLLAEGAIASLDDTADLHAPAEHIYRAGDSAARAARYDAFASALDRLYGT